MNKEQLFNKYNIDESHSIWDDNLDQFNSVELFRIMHNKKLPYYEINKTLWILDFLDKQEDISWWVDNVMKLPNWGSLYLTAKRFVYRFNHLIINELNK